MSASGEVEISPLSGLPLIHAVTTELKHRPVWMKTDPPSYTGTTTNGEVYFFYTGEPGGAWATNLNFAPDVNQRQARPIRPEAPFQIGELDLKHAELEKLKAYALSVAIQSRLRAQKYGGGKFPLFVSSEEQRALRNIEIETPFNFQPIAIEDLWREAQRLTLSDKANETLRNLSDIEDRPGSALRLPIRLEPPLELPEPTVSAQKDVAAQSLFGLAYGCVRGEIQVVFELLWEQGYIQSRSDFTYQEGNPHQGMCTAKTVVITARGYQQIERLRKGDLGLTRKAFLVCRFTDELDDVYTNVYKPVGESEEVRCPIIRVKDVHHVDKIDDRIIHEIDQATIVVVDLTEQNFNVAFEAGYALALGKPVVWTLREPMPDKLPFDIQSHNILIYNPTRSTEFCELLKYRILAALDKAGSTAC